MPRSPNTTSYILTEIASVRNKPGGISSATRTLLYRMFDGDLVELLKGVVLFLDPDYDVHQHTTLAELKAILVGPEEPGDDTDQPTPQELVEQVWQDVGGNLFHAFASPEGKTCFGITTDDAAAVCRSAKEYGLPQPRVARLGRRRICYWPKIT